MWFSEDHRINIIKTHALKEIDLRLQILVTTLHSIMNTIGRTYASNQETNNGCISDNHNKIKVGPIYNPIFVESYFIVDLLMQQGLYCVNIIGRSWTTKKKRKKKNQTTPTYLTTKVAGMI